jgi:hypothetical protein
MVRSLVAVCVAVLALAAIGCGAEEAAGPAAGWSQLPASPLSPREYATLHWTGDEVLMVGGSDAPPCPPNASCIEPATPPLADGAAFDPATRAWRTLADAPVPFEWATVVQVDDVVYFAVPDHGDRPETRAAFLAYDVGRDRWTDLPVPTGSEAFEGGLVAAGDLVVFYPTGDEFGEHADWSFDPATGAWTELPDDPLPTSHSRWMKWENGRLVLRAKKAIPNPTGDEPWLVTSLDPGTFEWSGPRTEEPATHVIPMVNGVFPTESERSAMEAEWDTLSNPPTEQVDFGDGAFATALITDEQVYYYGFTGWAYDARSGKWIEIAPLEPDGDIDRTYMAADRELLAFGGIEWHGDYGLEGTFLNETWMWSPPDLPPS